MKDVSDRVADGGLDSDALFAGCVILRGNGGLNPPLSGKQAGYLLSNQKFLQTVSQA
ncbi:hypothetical protein H6F78_11295 [Coleofasciculus sp. FACHB-64]|uniref:hypothetical protein n=1 Tax=Cyanophyceae TaxID=3028117 RepID=UPI001684090B|nr:MULTISPECIES: hypothetical protein [unclassified Coleofasciculus]MBD1838135.1 hypothetical protein [Coleofasciculus sp. FACHB-501]MBD1881431.1 hypothetical protein [Coleofasciculus sp. FACHB-T130]MBD2046172.1 hypothetical protein [Coleofasciculus sp. FACHB-64]